jgi:hypothetical protein
MTQRAASKRGQYKSHNKSTKTRVVALLLLGESVAHIHRQTRVAESTIREWRDALTDEQIAEIRANRGGIVADLLFDYLQENLRTLSAIARKTADPKWLEKQEADKLAVLYGVMSDKSIRVLEAQQKSALHAEQQRRRLSGELDEHADEETDEHSDATDATQTTT